MSTHETSTSTRRDALCTIAKFKGTREDQFETLTKLFATTANRQGVVRGLVGLVTMIIAAIAGRPLSALAWCENEPCDNGKCCSNDLFCSSHNVCKRCQPVGHTCTPSNQNVLGSESGEICCSNEGSTMCGGVGTPHCCRYNDHSCQAHYDCCSGNCDKAPGAHQGVCRPPEQCVPDPKQVTCSAGCGNRTNNCGQPVDCGTCPPPNPPVCTGKGQAGAFCDKNCPCDTSQDHFFCHLESNTCLITPTKMCGKHNGQWCAPGSTCKKKKKAKKGKGKDGLFCMPNRKKKGKHAEAQVTTQVLNPGSLGGAILTALGALASFRNRGRHEAQVSLHEIVEQKTIDSEA